VVSYIAFAISLYERLREYVHCRAGKPPPGLHLDVMKEGKMIQVSYCIWRLFYSVACKCSVPGIPRPFCLFVHLSRLCTVSACLSVSHNFFIIWFHLYTSQNGKVSSIVVFFCMLAMEKFPFQGHILKII